MTSIFTLAFWKDALERAIKTAAQAAGTGFVLGEGFDFFTVDWRLAAGFALGGAVSSILTSIASAPIGTRGNASLVS